MKSFSHKLSNSLDLNEFKHITAKQIDQMVNAVQPKFKKKNSASFEKLYPFSKEVLLDDFGCLHGPYESDNLLVDSSESVASSDSDDYNDIPDLYADKEQYSVGTISTNPTERTSCLSKSLTPLKFFGNGTSSKNSDSDEKRLSLNAEHELRKFETMLERDFLKRFDQQMYKEDILFTELNSITGSDVFIKFQYLKNILELDNNFIENESFTTKDISVDAQNKNFIHMNSFSLDKKFSTTKVFEKFVSKAPNQSRSFRSPSKKAVKKALGSNDVNMEKENSDSDDYIINNESISSDSHKVTRRVPTKRLSKPNSILPNIKKSEVQNPGNISKKHLTRKTSKSDRSSAARSEASKILRQKSLKRAIDALSSKSSKHNDLECSINYKNLKSNVSLLDLYDSDSEGIGKIQKDNFTFESYSPRLSMADDIYNPISDALSNIGLEWQPWTNSNSSLHEFTDATETDTSLPSSSPNTDTEKSVSLASGSQKYPSVSKSASSLKLIPLNKWKSKSKASIESLNKSEPPILISKDKGKKKTDKPLIRQLTEKLIKNKKENELRDDPLKPILPAGLKQNVLEKEFRFGSPVTTTDADDELNTESSEMGQNYAIPPRLAYNETSSYYGTQSTAPSFSNTSMNDSSQEAYHNSRTMKGRVADRINQIGTISEGSMKAGEGTEHQVDNDASKNTSTKKSAFHYNDPYMKLNYDENGVRKSFGQQFQ